MNIIRRAREAAADTFQTYRVNLLLYGIRQNLGRYLKQELNFDQLRVQGGLASWSLQDLEFNEDAINIHLAGLGFCVKRLTVSVGFYHAQTRFFLCVNRNPPPPVLLLAATAGCRFDLREVLSHRP